MATANEVSCPTSMPRCPICLEPYVNPRKLPNCSHSFCEACIATYVIKSVETNEQNTGISCPLCKTLNHVPKDKATEWVNTLELNEAISGTDGIRATTNQLDCEWCRKYGITSKAPKMCFVCFEVLCVPCSLGRHSYKTLQSHKVVDVEAGTEQGLKQDDLKDIQVLKDYTVCRDHDERPFELYCKDDECLCCSKCVALNHRKCSDITDLQDNKLEIDVKAKLETAKDFIKKLIRFANNIKEAKNKSMDDMKGQTENIRKTLLELRTKVNRLLDGLDETAMGQAKAIYKKEKLKGEKETGILNETVDGLVACSSLAEAVFKYGCVSHYVGVIQEVEQKMRHSKTTILDISETLKRVELELQPQSEFQNFFALGPNDTDKIANVIEKHHNLEFEPLQGLNMLKDYRLTKTAEKYIKENYYCNDSPAYRDLVFLPNDSAVLVDSHNKYCCLTDRAYKVKDSYQLDRAGHSSGSG